MMEAVAKMRKLYIDGDYVMGEAVLLDNPKANQLKTLIDNGIKMSVSSRGVGNIGSNNMVEKFNLITFDIIPNQNQSDLNASMYGITEGILQDKEYDYDDNGNIVEVCTKKGCSLYEKEDIQKAIKERFENILEKFKV